MLVFSANLYNPTPGFSQTQPANKGLDGDNYVKTDQRDNEDHETNLDWVGFFGLLGAVGIVGARQSKDRR